VLGPYCVIELKLVVSALQHEYPLDTREVDPGIDELGDPSQQDQVIVAVPTGAPVGTGRREKAALLVQPQRLWGNAGQLRRYGDAVDAASRSQFSLLTQTICSFTCARQLAVL
jgi:hypothetical protein